jgi:hypothetical protein
LLDTTFPPAGPLSQRGHSVEPRGINGSENTGKKRVGNALLETKAGLVNGNGAQRPSSMGSSPLSAELQASPHTTPPDATNGTGSVRASLEAGSSLRQIAPKGFDGTQEREPAVGLETDPAQIVNLALNLSQTRRRVAVASKMNAPVSGRRAISTNTANGSIFNDSITTGGSLKQHLQAQRRISRNYSSSSEKGRASTASPRLNNQKVEEPNSDFISSPTKNLETSQQPLQLSEATLARAKKAKVALEAAAEYKRLLEYLPPVLKQSGSDSVVSSPGVGYSRSALSRQTSASNKHHEPGRKYNPLQALRNRRMRARERKSIDSEAESWKDLDHVRDWVDKVEVSSIDPTFQAQNPVPLPSFSARKESVDARVDPTIRVSPTNNAKPKQRRMDWYIDANELFADLFWAEQDGNKSLLENNKGDKIYPSARVSVQLGSDEVEDTRHRQARPSGERSRSTSLKGLKDSVKSKDPTPGFIDGMAVRRTRRIINKVDPRGRRRLGRQADVSDEDLSFSSSEDRDPIDTRPHVRRKLGNRGESEMLERQIEEAIEKDAQAGGKRSAEHPTRHFDDLDMNQNLSGTAGLPGRTLSSPLQSATSSKPNGDFTRADDSQNPSARSSFNVDRGFRRKSSLEGLDESLENSPLSQRNGHPETHIPNFSLNLSPPQSPLQDATKPTAGKAASRMNIFRGRRSGKRVDAAGEAEVSDQAYITDRSRKRSKDAVSEVQKHDELSRQDSSPKGGLFHRRTNSVDHSLRRTDSAKESTKGRRSSKDRDPESAGIRGMLRTGRIDQIVRNDFRKVDDFLRKKAPDVPKISVLKSANASYASSRVSSASEDENSKAYLKPRPKPPTSQPQSTGATTDEDVSDTDLLDRSRYKSVDLPSFTSPFSPMHEQLPKLSADEARMDPIARQQIERRQLRRPSRFKRLAPPKIDMRAVSPGASSNASETNSLKVRQSDIINDDESRRGSYGFPGPYMDPYTNTREVHQADMRLNAALGISGPNGRQQRIPVTGLSNLEPTPRRPSAARSRSQVWSISDGRQPPRNSRPTKHDVARIRVLLLSSGIKARQIALKCDQPRPMSLNMLPTGYKDQQPIVAHVQEHRLAGQLLSREMQMTLHNYETAAERFDTRTADSLHDKIASIREQLGAKLTPMVRAATDDADAFATELTTTHPLAIKQLNDSVDTILRRRRRRMRWMRGAAYVMLEWMLLGAMWWVWLIVVVIRICRVTVVGIVKGVRWILWLS